MMKARRCGGKFLLRFPYGQEWLMTPHQLLGGGTPEERILAGDVEGVRNLLISILYIGAV